VIMMAAIVVIGFCIVSTTCGEAADISPRPRSVRGAGW
jgi:hypothetical protein